MIRIFQDGNIYKLVYNEQLIISTSSLRTVEWFCDQLIALLKRKQSLQEDK